MTTTTPNVELLRQTMDEILANPDKHDQSMWARRTGCGTAYCFAGTACRLMGLEASFYVGIPTSAELTTGEVISEAAQRLLGLDWRSTRELFSAINTTADLKHYVDQIAEHGRIVEPIDRGDDA